MGPRFSAPCLQAKSRACLVLAQNRADLFFSEPELLSLSGPFLGPDNNLRGGNTQWRVSPNRGSKGQACLNQRKFEYLVRTSIQVRKASLQQSAANYALSCGAMEQ